MIILKQLWVYVRIKSMNFNIKNLIKNVIWGFGGQLLVIILGIIVPRIMIANYGSDVNGLLGTVGQIFVYLALLEAGIGQAAQNALYKPLTEKKHDLFSSIASSAQKYYRNITKYYALGVIVLSFVAPIIFVSEVSRITIFSVVLLEGVSGVLSFYFVQTKILIIGISGKGYVNNGVTLLAKCAGYMARIILASMGIPIVLLQATYFIITICKVFFYNLYFKRKFEWVNLAASSNNIVLKDRNSYVLTEIAWTLFSSTDMVILSIFVSTQLSSVYSVYYMVFSNLNVLLSAVYNNLNYMLGIKFHKNIEEYKTLHDIFTSTFMGIMTVLMSVSYVLIIPFIELYTNGVADIEYIYPSLPVLFCMVQLISWSRYSSGNLTGIAGYAKPTAVVSLIEALTNLVLSIVFVNLWGIVGVLFATVVALPIKAIWCVYIADKRVMRRSCWNTIKIWIANYLVFGFAILLKECVSIQIDNYGTFIWYGFLFVALFGILGLMSNIIANRKGTKMLFQYIRKR